MIVMLPCLLILGAYISCSARAKKPQHGEAWLCIDALAQSRRQHALHLQLPFSHVRQLPHPMKIRALHVHVSGETKLPLVRYELHEKLFWGNVPPAIAVAYKEDGTNEAKRDTANGKQHMRVSDFRVLRRSTGSETPRMGMLGIQGSSTLSMLQDITDSLQARHIHKFAKTTNSLTKYELSQ